MIGREIYKTEILKNYLSQEFLLAAKTSIDEYINTLDKNYITQASHGYYYLLSTEMQNKISELLPFLPNESGLIYLLKHTGPTGPHTDTNIPKEDTTTDPTKFGRTFIIPLETQPTNTIVFDQYLAPGITGDQVIPLITSLPETNNISNEIIETYFSQSNINYWVNKLSIETIFPWVAGDILIFDRNKIHTGDDYTTNKNGLIIWTTF